MSSCDTDIEPEVIQAENVYDEEYYQNLREYKKSDHAICYGFYAGYTSEASPSPGLHFTGLPDSLDIISLWSGIPSNNPAYVETSKYNERYLPTAYEEMNYIRKVKGTRIVMCTICRIGSTEFPKTDAGIEAYALHLVRCVLRNDLDGLDLDYEPEGDWLQNDNFTKFIKVLGQYLGPQSGTGKLLIVDFYNQIPPKDTEPYVDYFVRQCYTSSSARSLQGSYDGLSSWCPPEKFVAVEQMGWYWQNGGVKFTESDGNTVDSWGNPLYSVIGMAVGIRRREEKVVLADIILNMSTIQLDRPIRELGIQRAKPFLIIAFVEAFKSKTLQESLYGSLLNKNQKKNRTTIKFVYRYENIKKYRKDIGNCSAWNSFGDVTRMSGGCPKR